MPLPPTPPPPRRPSRPISRVSGRAPPPPWASGEGVGEGVEVATPPSGPSPTLGSFEIVRSLGKGSRGEVLEVRRLSDGSRFALKRSLRPLSGPAQRRHWLRECHAQRGAGPGPGLLPLLAAWEQRGRFHLLTPLCRAGSLGHLWRRGARGGGASCPGGVAALWRGVVSALKGVASLLRGVVWRVWREAAKRGGAWSYGGVTSFLRGGASAQMMTSPPASVTTPPDASSPLANEGKGGVADPKMGVADPKMGVSSPSPAIFDPWAWSEPSVATSAPQTERPVATFDPSVAISDPVATSHPSVATSHPPLATAQPPAGRPLAEWRLRGYLWDVLLALRHLHALPLAHGDVKPDNVLLDGRGRCRLADFGLSAAPGLGEGQGGGGDPRYVAPEGLVGEGRPPGDIFSLGLSVAELAGEGRLPGEGEGWRRMRSGGGGRLPPGLGEGLSPELRAVLAAMLDPDPRLRPTAAELLGWGVLRGAGRWRPLTRLADVALRQLEDWMEAVPALGSSLRGRFGAWIWGPRTPPRPPRPDPWTMREEEEEEEEGAPERGEGSRSPSPTPDPRRTLTFDDDDDDEDPEPLPPPSSTPPPPQ